MSITRIQKPRFSPRKLAWLDVIAIAAWGFLMLKYWLAGQLVLLIHPSYIPLVVVAAICLLIVAFLKGKQLLKSRINTTSSVQHLAVFPPGWASSLLIFVALLGFLITPKVFSSQTAGNRSISELLGPTRAQPQSFKSSVRPEDRTLVEWVRTVNVYPEPDTYKGQKAKVKGFVVHSPDMAKEYLVLSQFVITCCAADAYPIGLPVKLTESRDKYPPDSWLEIEGQMTTEDFDGKRHLTIVANSIKPIPQPKNPYSF
ncbi:TIGR03943 family putative permease subunit [Calothrix sp. PCC 6303]|uniref:TIGR03943 family putative permease subunit n=1 Tax=Calothrix sp. PCC 6303 TaxID=1170562 RepID=UPI0002A03DCB|nr:TIGR03943 family protein [Calothrix sp. PCC 6303]AFZ00647.1 hypothetical protein Cal6303_1604 [Calothrix sp. PCC 6303]